MFEPGAMTCRPVSVVEAFLRFDTTCRVLLLSSPTARSSRSAARRGFSDPALDALASLPRREIYTGDHR